MKRDGACTSIWQTAEVEAPVPPVTINHDIIYDVIIVGAGITGVTTALLLQQSGKNCLLVEAENAGFGTTGGTTAHLNTFYDTSYYQIINDFGEENAKLVAQGAKAAIGLIKNNIEANKIDCNFEEKDGWLFALNEKQGTELNDIVEAAHKVEVAMEFTGQNPFPIPYFKAVHIPGQAQFNPIQYIYGLLKAFQAAGGILIENCRVTKIEEGAVLNVETNRGNFRAGKAVYATHIPPGVNLLHFRCAPYRSYVIGIKLKNDSSYPHGLGYDMDDPYHYYRTEVVNGQKYLIAGGEDHKTGHEENTTACFDRLTQYVSEHFDVAEICFKWSSQYYEPTDGLPYIGNLPGHGDNVFVATGFSGNGMIYGSLSALVLSNIIINGDSAYKKLFDPKRVKPIAGFSNFLKEGADVVKVFVSGLFAGDKIKELGSLKNGEAKLLKQDGHTMGVYRDEQGEIFAVNSACPHIKCTVGWNNAEKSWDCPCHGSRFSYDGKMLTAPAVSDLKAIDITAEKMNEL